MIVRVDFNVPMDGKGHVTDETRIVKTLPTIHRLIKEGGRIILISHLGRPKSKRDTQYSLKPVAERLSKLIKRPVKFVPDCIGPDVKKVTSALKNGELSPSLMHLY